MKDSLGDRMKVYEGAESDRRLMPLLPVLARVDGRTFHSFTRGMERPFDTSFSGCMLDTTAALVRDTGACMGYTQSDEITLAWHSTNPKSQIWFDGRVAKMTSQLGAQATLTFYRLALERMPEYAGRLPTFDARVWTVPNRAEGANVFLWREWDATKNSVSMAAAAYYSHKELMGKNSPQKHDMLRAKGVNWNNYPPLFKRGAYVQRRTVSVPFSAEELDRLPPKHQARTNPALVVERSVCSVLDIPPLGTVTNREAVIFDGVPPMLAEGTNVSVEPQPTAPRPMEDKQGPRGGTEGQGEGGILKIKEIKSQSRRDFIAVYVCEHCGHEHEGYGYDDDNFHRKVIPAMSVLPAKRRPPRIIARWGRSIRPMSWYEQIPKDPDERGSLGSAEGSARTGVGGL
jgi:tRNA(His) 5'-end guanylyltransferase